MINRGSEWRRWELHLHTPETKKADEYRGRNKQEKWDNFYSTISEYIGDGTDPLKSICAIAVTDYLSIDNYLKICQDNRLPDCVKFVFPNVELRMTPLAKNAPINIHCLFNPKIVDELEEHFFAKLEFKYRGTPYGATRNDLIHLGRDFCGDSTISESDAYHVGLNQYVISLDILSDIFESQPSLRENTIVVVSNKSNDGVSGLRAHSDYFQGSTSQLEATRRAIYQFADMVYSSNPTDIAYFLGEGTADDAEVVKRKCGSLMPCIHGSDAHSNDRIFRPDDDRFCWIKADPTFEGLKQVLYEPKERVRISSTIPDLKSDYYVIDRVEIEGNGDFSPELIYMSDKLTCIIGGKSTGKSLLLHNMANALDREQVSEKSNIATTSVRSLPTLKVFWKDGKCSTDKDIHRKIVYIPQTYLNRLIDEGDEYRVNTNIDGMIRDIILQDADCKAAYDQMTSKIASIKQEIAKGIVDFLQTVRDKKILISECSEIGDLPAISAEIEKLTSQLNLISGEVSITEEDINCYQNAVKKCQSLKNEIDSVTQEIVILKNISTVVAEKSLNHSGFNFLWEYILEGIALTKQRADVIWIEQREKIVVAAEERLYTAQQELESENKTLDSLQPKIDSNERIRVLSAKIAEAEARQRKLEKKLSKLRTLEVQYDKALTFLSASFENFGKIYSEYVSSINNSPNIQRTDLKFSAARVCLQSKLQDKLIEIINNKTFRKFKPFDLQNISETDLSSNNVRLLIEALIKETSETVQLKNAYNIENGLREILFDWYTVHYTVEMDNDKIQDMSPGKRALVLLRLLISLAESKCPILIDQPEDDLDNRSVFGELVGFIRNKKIERQIIVVTHNANIVLGGDAELVIVANREGSNAANCHYKFEYRCGSIEDNSPVLDDNGQPLQGILNQKGMQEHICEILEGGEKAFSMRRHKYHFISAV